MALLLAWAGINAIAFLAFGWDKHAAECGLRRTPETTLLTLALIGGALGALLGQQFFRHKTQKQPFRFFLWCCALANIGVALFLVWQVSVLTAK